MNNSIAAQAFKTWAFALVSLLSTSLAHAMPISEADRLSVNGTTWAQADLFRLTWNDINDQCPGGVCAEGSTLNGYDMGGWIWAAPDNVSALFNYYLEASGVMGSDLLDPSQPEDSYVEFTSGHASWIEAISDDFRYTSYDHTGGYYLNGWASQFEGRRYGMDAVYWNEEPDIYRNRASSSVRTDPGSLLFGAWFYCTDNCPDSQPVSLPSTPLLITVAFIALGMNRRKKGQAQLGI